MLNDISRCLISKSLMNWIQLFSRRRFFNDRRPSGSPRIASRSTDHPARSAWRAWSWTASRLCSTMYSPGSECPRLLSSSRSRRRWPASRSHWPPWRTRGRRIRRIGENSYRCRAAERRQHRRGLPERNLIFPRCRFAPPAAPIRVSSWICALKWNYVSSMVIAARQSLTAFLIADSPEWLTNVMLNHLDPCEICDRMGAWPRRHLDDLNKTCVNTMLDDLIN